MAKRLLFVLIVLVLLAGCGDPSAGPFSTPTPTPTPTPHESVLSLAEQLASQNMAYQLTKDAAAAQLEASAYKLTATAIVVANSATQTEQVRSDRATAVAQAKADKATQQSFEATQAQQGVVNAQTQAAWSVTVTAAVIATQTAYPMTATAQPMYATAEAGELRAKGTAVQGNADLVYLTVDRQNKKNNMDAYFPWLLVMVSFVVGILSIVMFSMYRQLKRDRNGAAPVDVVKHRNGVTYVNPDQMPGSSLTVSKDGRVTQTDADTDVQVQTTRRRQLVDLAKGGRPVQEVRSFLNMLGSMPGTQSGNINYFDADRFLRGVLGDAEGDVVDGEVTDAN